MDNLIMILGLGLVFYIMWRGLNNKPILPFMGKKTKGKSGAGGRTGGGEIKTSELKGDFKDLIEVKRICGNLIELFPENNIRTFVGAVRCEPINYQLRSIAEQNQTDDAYENLFASLSLGTGREVKIAVHLQSRPIELVDQMKQYHDSFPKLDAIAQRYAQSMFFPFMQQWQNSVDEFDYARYFFVILEYDSKMVEGLEDDQIDARALNEFVRLSGNIISNFARMGGIAEECSIVDLLEAVYFATHKSSGSVEGFRSIVNKSGRLSNVVIARYSEDSRPAYRYVEEESD